MLDKQFVWKVSEVGFYVAAHIKTVSHTWYNQTNKAYTNLEVVIDINYSIKRLQNEILTLGVVVKELNTTNCLLYVSVRIHGYIYI